MSGWQNGKIDKSQLSGFGVSVSQDQRGFYLALQPTFNNHTGRNPSRERHRGKISTMTVAEIRKECKQGRDILLFQKNKTNNERN